jgi:hypothetical protein
VPRDVYQIRLAVVPLLRIEVKLQAERADSGQNRAILP